MTVVTTHYFICDKYSLLLKLHPRNPEASLNLMKENLAVRKFILVADWQRACHVTQSMEGQTSSRMATL